MLGKCICNSSGVNYTGQMGARGRWPAGGTRGLGGRTGGVYSDEVKAQDVCSTHSAHADRNLALKEDRKRMQA